MEDVLTCFFCCVMCGFVPFIKEKGFIPMDASITFEKAAKSKAECQSVCNKQNAVLYRMK